MSEKPLALRRQLAAFCRERLIRYYNEGQYPSPSKQVRMGGRWDRKLKTRVLDRLANGMIIHQPNYGQEVKFVSGQTWKNPRIYLLHYGEPLDEVELALAQLKLFNPTNRTEVYVIACDGERP